MQTTESESSARERHLRALRTVLSVMGSIANPIAYSSLAIKFRQVALQHRMTTDAFVLETTGFANVPSLREAIRRTMSSTRLTERAGDGYFRVMPEVARQVERLADPVAALKALPVSAPVVARAPSVPPPVLPPPAPPPASAATGPYGEDEGEFDAAANGHYELASTLDQFVLLCGSPMVCWVRADMHGAPGIARKPGLRLRASFPMSSALRDALLEAGVLINRQPRPDGPATYEVQTEMIRVMVARGEISKWAYEVVEDRFQTLHFTHDEESGFASTERLDEAIRGMVELRSSVRAVRRELLPAEDRTSEIAKHQAIIDRLRAQEVDDARTAAQLAALESLPRLLFLARARCDGRLSLPPAVSTLDGASGEIDRLAAAVGMTRDAFLANMLTREEHEAKG